jgi:hypothetical protein
MKGKGKFDIIHFMQVYRWNSLVPPLILNHGMGCELVASLKFQSLCPLSRMLGGSKGCMGPEAVMIQRLYGFRGCPYPEAVGIQRLYR